MQGACSVLWVSAEGATDFALRKVLADSGMHVRLAQSCSEVRQILADYNVPDVVFCDTALPDGTWADILSLVTEGMLQIPVIVVSRVVDVNLYVNALEMGAADFIAPPFYSREFSHVLNCAARSDVAVQNVAAA